MNAYTPDEQELIQQHESASVIRSRESYDAVLAEYSEAKTAYDRWQDGTLRQRHTAEWTHFGKWLFFVAVIAGSYGFNCFLIQEIVPDLVPTISHFLGFGEGPARFLATITLTSILFTILSLIRSNTDLGGDLAALRPGLHPAVAKPLRRRIGWKIAAKAAYLACLAYGYVALYNYISIGVVMEQQAAASAQELQNITSTLGGLKSASVKLDETIASNKAASFMVYYTLEWALHCAILFMKGHSLAGVDLQLVFSNPRRDSKRHREVSRRYRSATSRLRQVCQLRTPDDGVNALRSECLSALIVNGETREGESQAQPTGFPTTANGTNRSYPVRQPRLA
jgi:hypothetical protein